VSSDECADFDEECADFDADDSGVERMRRTVADAAGAGLVSASLGSAAKAAADDDDARRRRRLPLDGGSDNDDDADDDDSAVDFDEVRSVPVSPSSSMVLRTRFGEGDETRAELGRDSDEGGVEEIDEDDDEDDDEDELPAVSAELPPRAGVSRAAGGRTKDESTCEFALALATILTTADFEAGFEWMKTDDDEVDEDDEAAEAEVEGRDVIANAPPPVLEPLETHPDEDDDDDGDADDDDIEAFCLLSGCKLKCDAMLFAGAAVARVFDACLDDEDDEDEELETGAGYGSSVRGLSLPVHSARDLSSGSSLWKNEENVKEKTMHKFELDKYIH
jgi:hypothetical protein